MTQPDETGGEAGNDPTAPGTIGLWFWGSLVAFGAFLVLVPGRDPRARTWLVVGVLVLAASLAGLLAALRGRQATRRRP